MSTSAAPKKSHKVRNIVLAVIAVIVIISLATQGGKKDTPTPAASAPPPATTSAVVTPSSSSEAVVAPAPTTAPPKVEIAAIGTRKAPDSDATAAKVIAAARAFGIPVTGLGAEDASLCAGYSGCQSAAKSGDTTVVVFESADAAQEFRDTPAGMAVEQIGGRRYWLLVDYTSSSSDERSEWRNLERRLIP